MDIGGIQHLVRFSGGVCSWAAAKRVVERHSSKDVRLLFADTFIEDDDLYRFLVMGAANIVGIDAPMEVLNLLWDLPTIDQPTARGFALKKAARLAMLLVPNLAWIYDGRTPWEVMRDEKIIGNSKFDPCSKILKRQLLDRWRDAHCLPEKTVNYVGLDWTERHRLERLQTRVAPWRYEAPMTDPPYLSKLDMLAWLKREGIEPPRLYAMGFPHNNCGGFCIKAGQAQFALLLKTMPERYAYHEAKEEEMRDLVGDHSVMRDRRGGMSKPLSMKAFRERLEAKEQYDKNEWGGCGCAIDVQGEEQGERHE